MRIAPATRAELPALAALMAASPLLRRYRVTQGGARTSLAAARRAGDLLLVATDGDRAVGLAWLILTPALDRSAYLRLLLVAGGRRSHGVGAALLERAERSARARRYRHLALLVTRTNRRARAFYARHGYRHIGDLPGFVRPRIAEALYMKTWRDGVATKRTIQTRNVNYRAGGGKLIDLDKYTAVKKAILAAVPRGERGITLTQLMRAVPSRVPKPLFRGTRVSWYATTVKLDLEARGLIERVPGASPQRLRRP